MTNNKIDKTLFVVRCTYCGEPIKPLRYKNVEWWNVCKPCKEKHEQK